MAAGRTVDLVSDTASATTTPMTTGIHCPDWANAPGSVTADVWAAVPETGDAGAETIRRAIRGPDSSGTGHAMLVKASAALRRAIEVFEPQAPPLAALSRRVKEAFDPAHILNPGRMIEGS